MTSSDVMAKNMTNRPEKLNMIQAKLNLKKKDKEQISDRLCVVFDKLQWFIVSLSNNNFWFILSLNFISYVVVTTVN
jgi:hypothetical protein